MSLLIRSKKKSNPNGEENIMGSKMDRRSMLKKSAAAMGLALTGQGQTIYRSELGNITIALAGDTMPTRGLKPFDEENFKALVELVRNADIAI